jgi:hypothetical protein
MEYLKMNRPPIKQSAYADYVYNKIDEYFQQMGWAFTVGEFAEFAGLPITGNLRRRLNHAVAVGKLEIRTRYGMDKGRGYLYCMPNTPEVEGEIPF